MKRLIFFLCGLCFLFSGSLIAEEFGENSCREEQRISCSALRVMLGFSEANHLMSGKIDRGPKFFERLSDNLEEELSFLEPGLYRQLQTLLGGIHPLASYLLRCDDFHLETKLGSESFTRLAEMLLKVYMKALDAYSEFITRAELLDRMDTIEGQFVGVGIATEKKAEYLDVIEVLPGAPAKRAGIKIGDRIFRINGSSVKTKSTEEISRAIRGPRGTRVMFSIKRNKSWLALSVVRNVVAEQSVTSDWLDVARGIGRIQIQRFVANTRLEVLQAWSRLNGTRPVRSLILDLRFNPGGLLNVAREVVDLFIDRGPVVFIRGAVSETIMADARGVMIDVPMLVLVNERSASAAEIVAGALQNYHRALLIGTKTFGKSTIQSVFETERLFGIPYSGAIKLTGFAFYLADGRPTSAIEPDIWVHDPSIEEAIREAAAGNRPDHGIQITEAVDSTFRAEESRGFQMFRLRAALASTLQFTQKDLAQSRDIQTDIALDIFRKVEAENLEVAATRDIISLLDLSHTSNDSL